MGIAGLGSVYAATGFHDPICVLAGLGALGLASFSASAGVRVIATAWRHRMMRRTGGG
jgi:hypothetical protein